MFERSTENARRVIVLAQEESRQLALRDIRATHLLLGLLRVDDGETAGRVLGITLPTAHDAVAEASPPDSSANHAHIPFAKNAKRAMELASDEAQRHGDATGTEHLLLGVLAVHDQQVDPLLTSLGVVLDAARAAAQALVGDGTETPRQDGPAATPDRSAGGFTLYPSDAGGWGPRHEALVAALHRFGRHHAGCPAPAGDCTCGFDAALAEADDGPRAD